MGSIKAVGARTLAEKLKRAPGAISSGISAIRHSVLRDALEYNKIALRRGLHEGNAPRSAVSVKLRGNKPALSGLEGRLRGEVEGSFRITIAVIARGAKFLSEGGVTSSSSMIPGKFVPPRTLIEWTPGQRRRAMSLMVSVSRRAFS